MKLNDLRAAERHEFLATLHGVGPTSTTLCARWTAADIAAHIVASERGWGLPMVAGYQLRRVLPPTVVLQGMQSLQTLGDRQIDRGKAQGWDWLLRRLAAGPPRPYRLSSVAPIRLIEEWIHHEDVRRASGDEPRVSTVDTDEALWQAGLTLTRFREFLPGRTGVLLMLPDGRSHALGPEPTVSVQGAPGELLLFLAGRTSAARVQLDGDADAISALHDHLVV